MSAWRIVAHELYRHGGSLPYEMLIDMRGALQTLRHLGLARPTGWHTEFRWQLTRKGRDYCEGRIKPFGRNTGLRFIATWLAALPAPGSVVMTDRQVKVST